MVDPKYTDPEMIEDSEDYDSEVQGGEQ